MVLKKVVIHAMVCVEPQPFGVLAGSMHPGQPISQLCHRTVFTYRFSDTVVGTVAVRADDRVDAQIGSQPDSFSSP